MARCAEGFHDELNSHMYDLERLYHALASPWNDNQQPDRAVVFNNTSSGYDPVQHISFGIQWAFYSTSFLCSQRLARWWILPFQHHHNAFAKTINQLSPSPALRSVPLSTMLSSWALLKASLFMKSRKNLAHDLLYNCATHLNLAHDVRDLVEIPAHTVEFSRLSNVEPQQTKP